jgi:photosystem II stability/assembly factor-like uncharacterized protein
MGAEGETASVVEPRRTVKECASGLAHAQSCGFAVRMRAVRILLLTILFISPAAAQSWSIETTSFDTNLRAVSATHARDSRRSSAPVIWASGSHSRLLKSKDGGAHFRRLLVNAGVSLDLRGIQAFNEKIAYAMSSGEGKKSRIYKTTNAGEGWKLQFSDRRPAFFLDALVCISEKECYAISDPVDGKFLLLATRDGEHWQELPRDHMPAALPAEGAFAASGTCLSIYGQREIYFATGGPAARVFHSRDLGRTWTVTETPIASGNASSGIFSITREGNALVAVGGDYKDVNRADRTAAYSLDQGATWTLAAQPPGGFRSAVASLDAGTLAAVGPNGEDISNDHGAHWTPTDSLDLNTLAVLDGRNAWAAGPKGTIARWINRNH